MICWIYRKEVLMPSTPQVKIFLDVQEHAQLRLAAAIRGVSMTRFARQIVLTEAQRLTDKVKIQDDTAGNGTKGRSRRGH